MWVYRTAAEQLGVTPTALQAALDRGETIATLARECGGNVDGITDAVVEAELADVEALARIAGFAPADIAVFHREIRDYLVALVQDGEQAAEAEHGRVLTPV